MLNELKRREELEQAKESADNLLAQNQAHHSEMLAQSAAHHAQTIAEIKEANMSIHEANKVAIKAIVFSAFAVIIAAILPFLLENHFTKDSQSKRASQNDPTNAGTLNTNGR